MDGRRVQNCAVARTTLAVFSIRTARSFLSALFPGAFSRPFEGAYAIGAGKTDRKKHLEL
jgi:hypothetical protein